MGQKMKSITVIGLVVLPAMLSSCCNGRSKCWEEAFVGESATDIAYFGIWGSSGSNIFVVGDATAVHFNGDGWTEHPGASGCNGVWGVSESEVYAACIGRILRYDGEAWSDTGAEFRGIPKAIWGSSSEDIYVIGYYQETVPGPTESVIVHFDGGQWTEVQNDFSIMLESVWGTSADNIYAVGHVGTSGGAILHYDGNSWNTELEGLPSSLLAVWGISDRNIFAVGGGGYIIHFDGSDWKEIESGVVGELRSVWAAGEDAVFIGGSGTLMLYSYGVLNDIQDIDDFGVNSIWGTSRDNVFLGGLRHIDFNPVAIVLKSTCSIEEQIR